MLLKSAASVIAVTVVVSAFMAGATMAQVADPSTTHQPAGAGVPGGTDKGGRLRPSETGVPGGPESDQRIPEPKSRYTTCPDGSRGDLSAGGCLGGAK